MNEPLKPKPEPLDPANVRLRFHARATVPGARSLEILADDFRAIGDLASAVEELGHAVAAIEAFARPTVTVGKVDDAAEGSIEALMRRLIRGRWGPLLTPTLPEFADRARAMLWDRSRDLAGWEKGDATTAGRRRNAFLLADLIACAIAVAATYASEAPDLQSLVEVRIAELEAIRFGHVLTAQDEEPQP